MSQISPTTPVIIGAAQFTERLNDANYAALSPVDITAKAAQLALEDTRLDSLRDYIDMIMTARTFEDSTPMLAFPHGRASNFLGRSPVACRCHPNERSGQCRAGIRRKNGH